MVDMGLEPMAVGLLDRRSTDWANRPRCLMNLLKEGYLVQVVVR